jgi:hypothetical protein
MERNKPGDQKGRGRQIWRAIPLLALSLSMFAADGRAHCDTMNGPVVKAARSALESGDVRLVLPWIKPADEPEVRSVFDRVIALRTEGELARSISDRLFFETVVRLHRAGEGAPYTGLKESQESLEPGIAEAENSIEGDTLEPLFRELSGMLHEGLERSFDRLRSAHGYQADDVQAGRRFVEAYVAYLHQVEGLYRVLGPARTVSGIEPEPHRH